MQIHQTDNFSAINHAILTLGTFDGVHLGHKKIIESLQSLAQQYHGETVIISFDPHPRTILQPNALLQIITTLPEKIRLFKKTGIDHLVIYPFTEIFSNLSATAYIEDFIIGKFDPKIVVIGYDHHFGKDRTGNIELLKTYANKGHFKLVEIPAQTIHDNNISSTKIRNALLHGEIDLANELLGYPYFFSGTIVKGKQLGRTIGFKTANLQLHNEMKLVPGNGVYIVQVQWENLTLKGMMNIGTRPTVDGMNRVIEVHMLEFDQEIYGDDLTVTILQRMRNEHKFDGIESLKMQLIKDREATATYFERNPVN
jgi:riboflavin kinase/FMN adenylyltransferase